MSGRKKLIIIILIICVAICAGLLCKHFVRPFWQFSDHAADDTFSKNVKNAVGKTFFYQDHVDSTDGISYYYFIIQDYSPESISSFCEALNDNAHYLDGKTDILVYENGGSISGCVFCLYNYADEENEVVIYEGFYRLSRTDWLSYGTFWDDPYTYCKIDKMCILEIPDKVQENADEEGIDWYEIWPDLEEVIVYETE